MKKSFIFAIALSVAIVAFSTTSFYIKGDANKDGLVDVADITTIAGYILNPDSFDVVDGNGNINGQIVNGQIVNLNNADANGDGVIDVADITCTASIILNDDNPFLKPWDTPYGIPPFDKIRTEHYIPAFKAGIIQQEREIDAITGNPEAPTFENTVAPYELGGDILNKTYLTLSTVYETDRNEQLDAVMNEAIPLISESNDNISFNKKLYERVAAVYNADQSNLTREQQVVLKKIYDNFVKNGVSLSEGDQDKLKKINSELSVKKQKISKNIVAENNKFKAKFGISISDYPNAMTTTEDRAKREEMLNAYTMRGHNDDENDNRQLFLDVIQLNIDKAKLLGYDNPASYLLEDKMAHDTKTVDDFLDGIMKAATVRAKQEVADMQVLMDEDIKAGKLPEGSKIQPWDWWYYAEKVRKQKYDLDYSLIKPYFKLENVVNGIFIAAKELYGVNMEKLENVPAYNKDVVTTYKVTDNDGNLLGIFTTDYLPRDSKSGGAWMANFINQYVDANGVDVRPVIENVANLEEYLTPDEVHTVFHEFGHALHGLLSKCHYPSISGTNVTRDYVEMPSQFNENWAFQPELLAKYAKNDKGEVIPDSLVEKIKNSEVFNQGFATSELCAASILDMKWYELTSTEGINIDEFEKKVAEECGLIPEIGFRYRTTYFNHIINGYEAGYYSYLWAEVLDKDAFSIFTSSGNTFNPELAKKFKETILERGGSEDPMVLYEQFAGRKPDNTAFLKARGLE